MCAVKCTLEGTYDHRGEPDDLRPLYCKIPSVTPGKSTLCTVMCSLTGVDVSTPSHAHPCVSSADADAPTSWQPSVCRLQPLPSSVPPAHITCRSPRWWVPSPPSLSSLRSSPAEDPNDGCTLYSPCLPLRTLPAEDPNDGSTLYPLSFPSGHIICMQPIGGHRHSQALAALMITD